MAQLLWGNVFYKEYFAGILREEQGGRTSFTYDDSYLGAGHPSISHTLPNSSKQHLCTTGLHPFFDNLVAEGWLEGAQTRLLGKRSISRFELLLAFGQDCAGAVFVIDPEPVGLTKDLLDMNDPKELAVMTGRASLSGIQPKLTLIERDGALYPTKIGEISSHIAKFSSPHHNDLVVNEYLTTIGFKALLPDDDVVDLRIGEVKNFTEAALIIKRFDRDDKGNRIHFEEFNQLLGHMSNNKYDGSHKDMADFISNTKNCLPAENYRLYLRILAGLLLGNTDMHFKNFAMFYTDSGLRLTPSYDQVAAAIYQYKTIALSINNASNLNINALNPANLIKLGEEFKLNQAAINMAINYLAKNLEAAKQSIFQSSIGNDEFKNQLINMIGKRWNGTFTLIGQQLLKKR